MFGVQARYDDVKISNEAEVHYVRDVNGDVLAEYDFAGNLLAEYVYANGQRIAKMTPGDAEDIYLNDHLGSARAMTESGWSANYYPFGEVASQTGSDFDTRFDFTGQERDQGTGLMYFGARYYDPEIGRWLSHDPLAQKFPSWSPYNYALDNPVGNFDPDGREARFSSRSDADSVATYLNSHLDGADIGVEERTGTNDDGEEFTYFALTVGKNSTFDFGANALTKGLFDVITSTETVFNVVMQTGGSVPGVGNIQDLGGGFTDPFKSGGGATIYLDRRGDLNKTEDFVISDVGIVFMHEAVGHGSPFYQNRQAVEINERFSKFNPPPAHGGYAKGVKWKGAIGLWGLTNHYPRFLVNRKRALLK